MLEITMTSFGATAPLVVKNKIENEPTAAATPRHFTILNAPTTQGRRNREANAFQNHFKLSKKMS